MNPEIFIVLAVMVGAVVLFTIEKIPADLTALVVMAVLLLSGIVSPEEGIAGFSNSATVTIAAMFVLSAALFNSGALNFFSSFLRQKIKSSYKAGLLSLMITSGGISAFINNTAVVALFMPIVMQVSRITKIPASKLLMPLSFAAILGGVCTLIGTSTNLLTNSLVIQHDLPPIGMFEFTLFGIILLLTGVIYMMFIGEKILPHRDSSSQLTETFEMSEYITEIILLPGAKSLDHEIRNSPIVSDLDVDIIEIEREDGRKIFPSGKTVLKLNDVLKVRCSLEDLQKLKSRDGIKLKPYKKIVDEDLSSKDVKLVEAVIPSNSWLIGRTVKGINFRNLFGATVLAIRHRGKIMHDNLGNTSLLPGDVLLIEVKKDWLFQLRRNSPFIIISDVPLSRVQKTNAAITIITFAAVILTAAVGIMPIVVSSVAGCVVLVLSGCITLEDSYKAIDWKVIFLLAGLITLGIALENSGGADLISLQLISLVGRESITILTSTFFFLSMALTAFMSNNASVALLIPIAITTSESLGIDSRPLIVAVTIAASIDFMTPIGYQTNTMIYGPGNYKFTDYMKVGTPLNLLFWLLGSLLIPVFF